jgi:hypothetical protein
MTKFILILLAWTLVGCSESAGTKNMVADKAVADKKLSVAELERSAPAKFLAIKGAFRKNMLGRWVLEGKISNKATKTSYHKVIMRIVYYSASKKKLGSEEKMFPDLVKPGEAIKFSTKRDGYKEAESIGYEVVGASLGN